MRGVVLFLVIHCFLSILLLTCQRDFAQGGLTVKADVKSNTIPFRGWAKIKRSAFGFQSSARFDVDSDNLNKVGVDLAILGGPTKTGLLVSGSVDTEHGIVALENVKVSQNVDSLGGVWSVVPSYNVGSQKGNVQLAYGSSGIAVSLDADVDQQKLTVAKGFGANVIAPSITNQGDVEVQFTRMLPTGSVVATIKSNDSVNIKWSDGKWIANINAPIGRDFAKETRVTLSCMGVNL